MLTKTTLDAQTTVELPAREMLAFFNFNFIGANQAAGNSNTQLNLVGLFQVNASSQNAGNAIVVGQS
jgi:hypothetical protein